MGSKYLTKKVEQWNEEFLEDIERISKGQKPKARRFLQKLGLHIAVPILCSPCIAWSGLWRILACPFQCLGNGPGYCCSNNGCTTGSDLCLEQIYDHIGQKYPWMQTAYDASPALASSVRVTLVTAFGIAKEAENPDFQRTAIQTINEVLVLLRKPKVYILHHDMTTHKFQTLLEE